MSAHPKGEASQKPSDVEPGSAAGKGKGKVEAVDEIKRLEYDVSDIDRILAQEATGLQREEEVSGRILGGGFRAGADGKVQANRILTAFKLNPYDVLGVDKDITDDELRECSKQRDSGGKRLADLGTYLRQNLQKEVSHDPSRQVSPS